MGKASKELGGPQIELEELLKGLKNEENGRNETENLLYSGSHRSSTTTEQLQRKQLP